MCKINVLLFANDMQRMSFARIFENSFLLNKLFICGECNTDYIKSNKVKFVNLNTINDYKTCVKKNNINLVINTYTIYARMGFVNFFKYNLGIPSAGITRYWSQLETSKLFAKRFMRQYNLPSSEYFVIENISDLERCIQEYGFPLVIKDNIVRRSFGTYICNTKKDCIKKAKELLRRNKFFTAEKYIEGEEVTLHTLWDGNILLPLEPVRDYKRLKNGGKGINTGSMGSYTPVNLSENQKYMINGYVKKLESVFKHIKPNFTGIFASDLIFTEDKIFNLEFNMRPCTQEFEVLIEHLDCDLLEVFYKTAISKLEGTELKYKTGITGAVNIVHKDYERNITPSAVKKIKIEPSFLTGSYDIKINTVIKDINNKNETIIHPYGKLITLLKNDCKNPFPFVYKYLNQLKNKDLYYRTDIGNDIKE